MILSFHPCFETEKNIICAGRNPCEGDLAAIQSADAVILPTGCSESLYRMTIDNCPNVFPNFDARFNYPGKIGQIKLFRKTGSKHPATEIFENFESFLDQYGQPSDNLPYAELPFVFKFNWGGEGETVYLIKSKAQFQNTLQKAEKYESTGQAGFLLQQYIPSDNRSLRVVIIGSTLISYWRIHKGTDKFCSSVFKGAVIDNLSDPDLQHAACVSILDFCSKTGINLAGFDFLFSSKSKNPFFLEINYFFGREGLGGSEKFYNTLSKEIRKWIECLGL